MKLNNVTRHTAPNLPSLFLEEILHCLFLTELRREVRSAGGACDDAFNYPLLKLLQSLIPPLQHRGSFPISKLLRQRPCSFCSSVFESRRLTNCPFPRLPDRPIGSVLNLATCSNSFRPIRSKDQRTSFVPPFGVRYRSKSKVDLLKMSGHDDDFFRGCPCPY